MITSVFEKTRPVNYVIIAILAVVSFTLYYFSNDLVAESWRNFGKNVLYLLVVLSSLALVNFITLKNTLNKNNNFAIFLFLVFILFFSKVFQNTFLLASNFFILLALRRLISIRTMKEIKEKLFDATFWILIASLFHFWAILYLILVFVSIVLHVSKDYRNWLIPLIALFSVSVLFLAVNLYYENNIFLSLKNQSYISFDFTYFETIYQNIALALFASVALLFFSNMLFSINSKPLNLQSSFKTVLFSFVIGILVYILSANKQNAHLIYCFAPLAIMGGNFMENLQNKMLKEIILNALTALGIFFFVMSL